MRIQHNIPAMNAYRNYNTNTKALQGNLQKLSSGYKINKAGDDAAGLAISEKMRAQITGLEVAQKNAKDGISLVQTAEGALTEVHTMLNRMYSLAEQSANGTYADEVDREQLQKEVQSLRDEIDRIADATNFNGKKLLDGSLGSAGGGVDTGLQTTKVDAVAGSYRTSAGMAASTLQTGDKIDVSFVLEDGKTGKQSTVKLQFEFAAGTSTGSLSLDGKEIKATASTNAATADELTAAIIAGLKDNATVSENFTIKNNASTTAIIDFTAKNAGESAMKVVGFDISHTYSGGSSIATTGLNMVTVTAAKDAFEALDVSKITAWDGKEDTLEKSIFEVNGQKFVLGGAALTSAVSDTQKKLLADAGVGNNFVVAQTPADSNAAGAVSDLIKKATGLKTSIGNATSTGWSAQTPASNTYIALEGYKNKAGSSSKGGLSLQIGDTSDEYNKMRVSVDDMHAEAMGIGSIDIGTEDGASAAMKSIKDAINYVSNTRGTLGALQNRLDHTINNLSVQQENIQDAEATIRDVDVANEMMAYTKNNILVQSAQAMLAQANQLPQGVLQLLG